MPGLGVGVGVGGGLLAPILFGGVIGAGAGITLLYLGAQEEGLEGLTKDPELWGPEEGTKAHSVVEQVKAHSIVEKRPMRGFAASFA